VDITSNSLMITNANVCEGNKIRNSILQITVMQEQPGAHFYFLSSLAYAWKTRKSYSNGEIHSCTGDAMVKQGKFSSIHHCHCKWKIHIVLYPHFPILSLDNKTKTQPTIEQNLLKSQLYFTKL